MRYVCTECKIHYGEGPNKPWFGFCSGCWDIYLAAMHAKSRQMMEEHWRKVALRAAQK